MNNNNDDDDNMLSISEIDNALEQCGEEIESLYRSLDLVMDRQVRLAQEKDRQQMRLREQQEQQRERAAAQQHRQHEEEALRQREQDAVLEKQQHQKQQQNHIQQQQKQSEDTLAKQARITELRRQIQEVEDATKVAKVTTAPTKTIIPVTDVTEEQELLRQIQEVEDATNAARATGKGANVVAAEQAPITPTPDPSKKNSKWKNPFRKSKSPTATDSSPSTSPLPSPKATAAASDNVSSDAVAAKTQEQPKSPGAEVCKGHDYSAKQKHEWERPAWALPSDAVQEDTDILTAPIQNGMLKEANKSKGYTRRCMAKDIHKVEGSFIAATPDPAPASRFAWLVLNLDGEKVGKIVMHLKEDTSSNENVDRLVGQFLDLKGLAMERTKDGNLVVNGVNPEFVITIKKTTRKKRGKSNIVIGEIEEGQDVFETVLKAGVDSIVTIKQAHIYPVKKAKGMFA